MAGGTRIHVLSDHVINKIAAGEVVDRPASVVKELMENALDAGATRVQVEVIAGGRTLIRVADDGHGMSRDDALLSIERHATSKIRDVDDIERIRTMGFRGEALAAIAAVSRFTLQTSEPGAAEGTELQVSGGRVLEVNSGGFPPGADISIRNLFFNVPARRRFLRTDQTELSHVRQAVLFQALSHPEIGIRFTADGRVQMDLPPGETLSARLRRIYPRPVAESLLPVDHTLEGVRVHGLAGVPMMSRGDRSEQYVFVNRRAAGAPLIHHALHQAYQTLLPNGRYPTVFLFIETAPENVDVNVHPTKKEVRFRCPGAVRDAVIESVRLALSRAEGDGAGLPAGVAAPPPNAIPPRPEPRLLIPDLPEAPPFVYPRMPAAPPESLPGAAAGGVPPEPSFSIAPAPEPRPWAWCRVVGQLGGLFVVLETDDGLVLMDPHAAHERVLFEKLMDQSLRRETISQGLLMPETVSMGNHDAEIVRAAVPALKLMGFGVAEFGGDSFIVDAVPALLGVVTVASLLPELARSLDEGGASGGTERWIQERIATAACRAAVKARDRLSLQEIERLVVDLAVAKMPYTCPHGRPTLIHFSYGDLHRRFGRSS